MKLDALAASRTIDEAYRRYLRTLMPVNDRRLEAAFHQAVLTSDNLLRGPFLEMTPPYVTGHSIRQLVDEGVLAPAMLGLDSSHLPVDRSLYLHQETSCRKAAASRNLVVASGTGSGKTESFLLPILSNLLAEREKGALGPGVRALLLYPMNALANDQMKRLRQLLAARPEITFGRYTGETKERLTDARDEFRQINPGEPELPNELISREQMRKTPPHLLLTNYAMLEYLLLRPDDLDLFEGPYGGAWRFVVVDEAHVYDGAKGAELGLLLRRLKQRVAASTPLQCFATSATVGDAADAVTTFASELFDVPFEWVPDDAGRQDLVTARRRRVDQTVGWGPLSIDELRRLQGTDDPGAAVLAAAAGQAVTADSAFQAMACERRFSDLVQALAAGPREARPLAEELFDHDDEAEAGLTALVTLASSISDADGVPLLSARYHLMARATEGAFMCLGPEPHVVLARAENCATCGHQVHELASCRRCGAVHLFGCVRSNDVFEPRLKPDDRRQWLLLDTAGEGAEDEDDASLADFGDDETADAPAGEGRRLRLCPVCNTLTSAAATGCPNGCAAELRTVIEVPAKGDDVRGCLSCGGRGSYLIRTFESGNEASVSVLGTALYQQLPEAEDAEVAANPGQGRKVLFFSDSRQQAAYFAPYLEDTYAKLQQRRLLLLSLESVASDGEPVRVDDIVDTLIGQARGYGLFGPRDSRTTVRTKVAPWVMRELMALDGRQSLEGVGLIRVGVERPQGFRAPAPLTALGLTEDESWDLIDVLVSSLRQQGALSMTEGADATADEFKPRLGPIYVREQKADRRAKVISWLPTSGTNRRVDFLSRLGDRIGQPLDPHAVLTGLWKWVQNQPSKTPILLPCDLPYRGGIGFQLDCTALLVEPVGDDRALFRCDRCQQVTGRAVRGVCPTIGCRGTLEQLTGGGRGAEGEHYRALYRSMLPVSMHVMEHTAQWAPKEAAKIQQDFVEGRVNALSCSTTFELGVDVGELETVVMRNVPPSTANYLQRAGRAGRRSKSAALVLTYAQRRSHDLSRFAAPLDLIKGLVRSPHVTISNERLARRHVHSVALASFWRHEATSTGRRWRHAGEFLLPPEDAPTSEAPYLGLGRYLDPVPEELRQALSQVVPPPLHQGIGLDQGEWVEPLTDLLDLVAAELTNLVEFFTEQRQLAFENKQDQSVQRFGRVLETLRKRPLLAYLAAKNVLPKYGFPVDVVELRTQHTGEQLGRRLSLERDLSSAIHEYAPGSSIVAGGRVWTSAGIYRLPKRDLVESRYVTCRHCSAFHAGVEEPGATCTQCGQELDGRPRTYVIPEFGFVAKNRSAPAEERAPRQFWNGSTHILRLPEEADERVVQVSGGTVTLRTGQRGRLVKLSEGPGGAGFRLCDWCGFGEPIGRGAGAKTHQHPMSGRDCSGTLRNKTLAHEFETDFLEIRPRLDSVPPWSATATWRSAMYALLEGAAMALDIAREDIDGALHHHASGPVIALVDDVPGGAGLALRIGEHFDEVARAAEQRLRICDCEPATSCYACLRSYGNQRYHHELSRGDALQVVEQLVQTG